MNNKGTVPDIDLKEVSRLAMEINYYSQEKNKEALASTCDKMKDQVNTILALLDCEYSEKGTCEHYGKHEYKEIVEEDKTNKE